MSLMARYTPRSGARSCRSDSVLRSSIQASSSTMRADQWLRSQSTKQSWRKGRREGNVWPLNCRAAEGWPEPERPNTFCFKHTTASHLSKPAHLAHEALHHLPHIVIRQHGGQKVVQVHHPAWICVCTSWAQAVGIGAGKQCKLCKQGWIREEARHPRNPCTAHSRSASKGRVLGTGRMSSDLHCAGQKQTEMRMHLIGHQCAGRAALSHIC